MYVCRSLLTDRYKTEQSIDIIARLFRGDGGAKIASVIAESGEPWPQGLAAYQKTYEATKSTPPTVDKLWDTQIERLVFVKKTLEHWQATASHTGTGRPIDGLLSPTTPWAASPKHGFEFHIPYTGTWNLTDQSATTFPAGFSTLEDVNADGYVGRNEIEKKIWARCKSHAGSEADSQMIPKRALARQ
jgi:amidase